MRESPINSMLCVVSHLCRVVVSCNIRRSRQNGIVSNSFCRRIVGEISGSVGAIVSIRIS